jgi:hypothetical protein
MNKRGSALKTNNDQAGIQGEISRKSLMSTLRMHVHTPTHMPSSPLTRSHVRSHIYSHAVLTFHPIAVEIGGKAAMPFTNDSKLANAVKALIHAAHAAYPTIPLACPGA